VSFYQTAVKQLVCTNHWKSELLYH